MLLWELLPWLFFQPLQTCLDILSQYFFLRLASAQTVGAVSITRLNGTLGNDV